MDSLRTLYPCGTNRPAPVSVSNGRGFHGLGDQLAVGGRRPIDAGCAAAGHAAREIGDLSVHVRRREPHRHLRPQGQQARRQDHGRDRLRRQQRAHEASRDSDSAHVQALRKIGHSGVRLVSERRRDHRRIRGGALDVLPSDEPFSGRARRRDRQAAAPVRASLPGKLGFLCAGNGEQGSADLREHGPALVAGAIVRRIPGRELLRDAVSAGRRPDSESAAAEEFDRQAARPRDAGAVRTGQTVPRRLRRSRAKSPAAPARSNWPAA